MHKFYIKFICSDATIDGATEDGDIQHRTDGINGTKISGNRLATSTQVVDESGLEEIESQLDEDDPLNSDTVLPSSAGSKTGR